MSLRCVVTVSGRQSADGVHRIFQQREVVAEVHAAADLRAADLCSSSTRLGRVKILVVLDVHESRVGASIGVLFIAGSVANHFARHVVHSSRVLKVS